MPISTDLSCAEQVQGMISRYESLKPSHALRYITGSSKLYVLFCELIERHISVILSRSQPIEDGHVTVYDKCLLELCCNGREVHRQAGQELYIREFMGIDPDARLQRDVEEMLDREILARGLLLRCLYPCSAFCSFESLTYIRQLLVPRRPPPNTPAQVRKQTSHLLHLRSPRVLAKVFLRARHHSTQQQPPSTPTEPHSPPTPPSTPTSHACYASTSTPNTTSTPSTPPRQQHQRTTTGTPTPQNSSATAPKTHSTISKHRNSSPRAVTSCWRNCGLCSSTRRARPLSFWAGGSGGSRLRGAGTTTMAIRSRRRRHRQGEMGGEGGVTGRMSMIVLGLVGIGAALIGTLARRVTSARGIRMIDTRDRGRGAVGPAGSRSDFTNLCAV
jgi:hypothetical protein